MRVKREDEHLGNGKSIVKEIQRARETEMNHVCSPNISQTENTHFFEGHLLTKANDTFSTID